MGIGSVGNYGSCQAVSNAAIEAGVGKSIEAVAGIIDDDYEFTHERGSYKNKKKKERNKKYYEEYD